MLVPESAFKSLTIHLTGKFSKFLSVVVVTPAGIGQLGSVESPPIGAIRANCSLLSPISKTSDNTGVPVLESHETGVTWTWNFPQ